jgi:hypothetical protein
MRRNCSVPYLARTPEGEDLRVQREEQFRVFGEIASMEAIVRGWGQRSQRHTVVGTAWDGVAGGYAGGRNGETGFGYQSFGCQSFMPGIRVAVWS